MTAVLVAEGPGNGWAVHDCGYFPRLTGGRLVRKYDPAWQMLEKTRALGCLTERVRIRAHFPAVGRRWPGYGLGFFHSHRSTREYPGYPDCHIWGDRGAIVRELKRMGEVPKPDQVATLTRMRDGGGLDVGVWWPCCWYSGRIDAELAAVAGRARIGEHGHPDLPAQPGQPGYVPYVPGAVAPTTQPRLRPRAKPAGKLAVVRPGATVPAPAVVEMLGEPGATGYVIPAGLIGTASGGADMIAVRGWLRDGGVGMAETVWPLRIVAGADGAVHVQVAARTGAGPVEKVWRFLCPDAPFPAEAAGRLSTWQMAGSTPDALMVRMMPVQGASR